MKNCTNIYTFVQFLIKDTIVPFIKKIVIKSTLFVPFDQIKLILFMSFFIKDIFMIFYKNLINAMYI